MPQALPTRETAREIRPESIRTPAGKTELRALRSTHGKHFQHAERNADGKALVTYEARLSPVCYTSDEGELRTIDTTVRDLGEGLIGVEWAPYRMHLHQTGIGFTFHSREGGTVTVTLTGIDGTKFDTDQPQTPTITDNVITFHDVKPGLDIVFRCLNDRVKTLRILHDEHAPKTFEWTCESDRPDLIDATLTGTDAAGNRLDLTTTVDGNTITEAWTGETQDKTPAVYPVAIDPTVTAYPSSNAGDAGYQWGSTWYGDQPYIGNLSGSLLSAGLRIPNVNIPQGTTADSATLGMYANEGSGGGGSGTIYGRAADNPGMFDSSNKPTDVARTSASVVLSAASGTGQRTWTVTTIVQELLNRAGFVANNAMAFPIVGNMTDSRTGYRRSTEADPPYLSITYTASAASTAPNLLLLGCG